MSLGRNGLINCMRASMPGLIPEKMLTDGILMKRPASEDHTAFSQSQLRPGRRLSSPLSSAGPSWPLRSAVSEDATH